MVCLFVLLSDGGDEREHFSCFLFCMLFLSLLGDSLQNITHVVFIPLGSLLSSKQSIFKCSHGAPLYTTGHPVGMDLKQMNWSTTWVGQLPCGRGKSHLVSGGVGDPAETVELITLVTSFLTFAYILMWEQEAFSGVFLVAC